MSDRLMPILEAARLLAIPRSSAYRLARQGRLIDGVEVLYRGRKPMVRRADLERVLSGTPPETTPEPDVPPPAPLAMLNPSPPSLLHLALTNLTQQIEVLEVQRTLVQREIAAVEARPRSA